MARRSIPNVLFSTTRSWNPGDDFILYGVRRLLEPLIGPFNPIVFNRQPALHQLRLRLDQETEVVTGDGRVRANLYRAIAPHLYHGDNSWHEGLDPAGIDLAVFAGTPEWFGAMTDPLTRMLLAKAVPTLYLGLGILETSRDLSFDALPRNDRYLLAQARLVTVRDPDCAKLLGPVSPISLPCPALFSAAAARPRSGLRRIALSTQLSGDGQMQAIDAATAAFTRDLFVALSERYDCALIAHFADEAVTLRDAVGDDVPVIYSYDPRDYEALYDGFDLTVTTRVHGAGLCASLGIPGFVVSHSARSATTEGFLAVTIDPERDTVESVIARIEALDIAAASARLVEHRAETAAAYHRHLAPVLAKAGLLVENGDGRAEA